MTVGVGGWSAAIIRGINQCCHTMSSVSWGLREGSSSSGEYISIMSAVSMERLRRVAIGVSVLSGRCEPVLPRVLASSRVGGPFGKATDGLSVMHLFM